MIDLDAGDLLGWDKRIHALAFDVTGTRLVVAGGGGARLYDAGSGALVAALAHSGGVSAAAFAPDGAHLVTGSDDMGVRLWRSADGAPLALAKGHMHEVIAVAWAPAGDRFASASLDGSIRVWRLHGDEPVEDQVLHPRARPRGVLAWSAGSWAMAPPPEPPGGDVLVRLTTADAVLTGERSARVRVWTHDGELIGEIRHAHEVTLVTAPPAGEPVASCSRDGVIRLWSPAEAEAPQRRAAAAPEPVWAEDFGEWVGLALSPDGERLALSIGARVEIRAVATGAVLARADGDGPSAVHWHRDQVYLREGASGAWRVYDAGDLRPLGALAPARGEVTFAGDRMSLHCVDGAVARAHLYALAGGQPPQPLAEVTGRGFVDTVAPSPDGTHLVIGFRDQGATLINLRSGGVVGPVGHAGWGGAVFSPDGARLLTSGSGGVGVWDARTGARIADLGIPNGWHAAWSPTGARLAVASSDGPLWLLDDGGRELARHGGTRDLRTRLSNPSFSPDGALLCAWHGTQPVRLWEAGGGAVHAELSGHAGDHICIRFAGDQRLISWEQGGVSADLVRRLWDRDGRLVAPLAGHAGERFWELVVAPGDEWMASTVVGDPFVHVWRTADGEPAGPLGGHRALVRWACFAAGSLLITGCDGGTLKSWSLPR